MDRAIVQDQDQGSFSAMLLHQVFQESDEGFTVAFLCDLADDFIADPVVGAKEMTPLGLTWGRNSFLATSLHPTSDQPKVLSSIKNRSISPASALFLAPAAILLPLDERWDPADW